MADNNNNNPNIVPPDNDTPYLSAIISQFGTDTDEPTIQGLGYSPDNGVHFYVTDTIYGRKYRQEDADRIWPYLKKYVGNSSSGNTGIVTASLKWADIVDKPNLVTESELNQRITNIASSGQITSLDWGQITNKPDLATKEDLDKISSSSGKSGKDGKSAYEIAVDHGFVGSEEDWLQSLHGKGGTGGSGSSGDNSLSIEAISDLIKHHLRATVDVATGNLIVNVDETNDGSIADTVAAKVAQACQFKLDNGNLVLQIGGE